MKNQKRSFARLAAVQSLYQMEQAGNSALAAQDALKQGFTGLDEKGEPLPDPDQALFSQIIDSVVTRQTEINILITTHLAKGWRIERLDSISRAILRAAIGEKLTCPDTENAILLDEYVSIARAFLDESGTGFINALLSAAIAPTAKKESSAPQAQAISAPSTNHAIPAVPQHGSR